MFVEDLSPLFAPGMPGIEPVRINGTDLHAMVDRGTQLLDGQVLFAELSLLLPSAWAASAAEGQPVLIGTVPHRIRQIFDEPPDGALRRLTLVKG
jgi:hypothetical protein